jgi:hypothetical protein
VISIAVFVQIDAGTASSSPFQQTTKIVHDHAGIVFTFNGNLCHVALETPKKNDAPEYAISISNLHIYITKDLI